MVMSLAAELPAPSASAESQIRNLVAAQAAAWNSGDGAAYAKAVTGAAP